MISGYGLIEAPIDRVLSTFGTHHRADQAVMSVVVARAGAKETLAYLDLRTYGATRLALLDFGEWTAVLTNHKTGSDFADYQYWAGRTVGARTVRVVDSTARWRRDADRRVRLSWEMRSFELHSRTTSPYGSSPTRMTAAGGRSSRAEIRCPSNRARHMKPTADKIGSRARSYTRFWLASAPAISPPSGS